MIFLVKLNGIRALAETDEDMTPEQCEDYLNRCVRAVLKVNAALPDVPTETGGDEG